MLIVYGGVIGAEGAERAQRVLLFGRLKQMVIAQVINLMMLTQISDCWPVTSWSIVDYFLRPKPAYFTIARELRPFTVGMTRKEKQTFANERSGADFTIETVLEIWGTNSTLSDKSATLEVTAFDLESNWTEKWEIKIILALNSSTELYRGKLPGQPERTKKSDVPKTIVVSARLLDENKTVFGRYSNWYADSAWFQNPFHKRLSFDRPEPFKFIDFPPPEDVGLRVEIDKDGESVTLTCRKPIKGIILDAEENYVQWSDQAIDLVPGDPQTVRGVGLGGRQVKTRFLGDGTV